MDRSSLQDEVLAEDFIAKAILDLVDEARNKYALHWGNEVLKGCKLGAVIFEDVAMNVKSLHANMQLEMEAHDDFDLAGYFSALRNVYQSLDTLLHEIRRENPSQEVISISMNALKSTSTLAFESAASQPDTVVDSSLTPRTRVAPPSQKICYLETAISSLGLYTRAESNCDLREFAAWASTAASYDKKHFQTHYGSVREAHLFRSRKAPFHHEYVIVLLRNTTGEESWLRIERAARRKISAAIPQLDSAKPLFGGVRLRETASFAMSMTALVHNSDELATILMSNVGPPMYLQVMWSSSFVAIATVGHRNEQGLLLHQDLCGHVMGLSTTKPLYQLFSANCRWLARRGTLTIAQWGSATHQLSSTPHSLWWKGRLVTLSELSVKLKKELFGGRDIEGLRGIQLQTYSLAQLAGKLAQDGDHQSASEIYIQSLRHLETLVASTAVASDHMYAPFLDNSKTDIKAQAMSYDFMRIVHAVQPSPFRATLPLYFDSYATVLHNLNAVAASVEAMKASVTVTRETSSGEPDVSLEVLGLRLVDLSYYLQLSDATEEAFDVADEAIGVWRSLYKYDPERYRAQLAFVLDSQTDNRLLAYGDSAAQHVYEISREVLRLTRDAYARSPEYHVNQLIGRLSACSSSAASLGYRQEALVLSHESLSLARERYKMSPDVGRCQILCGKLEAHARAQQAAGHHKAALASMREMVSLGLPQFTTNPDAFRLSFARSLHGLAKLLGESAEPGHLDEALNVATEALKYRRILVARDFSGFPEEHRQSAYRELEATQNLNAKILYSLDRVPDALALQRDLVELIRNSPIFSLDDPKRRCLLADMLDCFARYCERVHSYGRAVEATFEALHYTFAVHATHPDLFEESRLQRAIIHCAEVYLRSINIPRYGRGDRS